MPLESELRLFPSLWNLVSGAQESGGASYSSPSGSECKNKIPEAHLYELFLQLQ